MNNFNFTFENKLVFIITLAWDAVWRGIALWKSAQRGQKYWFIPLLVINSVGILPIIYLLIDKYSKQSKEITKP